MALAVVRSLNSPRHNATATELQDFEQEIVDQFALAMVGAGLSDSHVSGSRIAVMAFARFMGEPLWTTTPAIADEFLTHLRRRRLATTTVTSYAGHLARFYDFVIARYQGDIHALTGFVVQQPIDEFNRPASTWARNVRVPPTDLEIDRLFRQWAEDLPTRRKYLTGARDYFAASLWRRVGLRIHETQMLDLRDWRPDLGRHGSLHVRFGKGARGRGPKSRMVPAINGTAELIDWWLGDVRHQFGNDWQNPDAPMLPSERTDRYTRQPGRVGVNALRDGLAHSVTQWLPAWEKRLTPHTLRHYCATSLYAHGVSLTAVQELLGHQWLETTSGYVHVHEEHVEQAWAEANERLTDRFGLKEG